MQCTVIGADYELEIDESRTTTRRLAWFRYNHSKRTAKATATAIAPPSAAPVFGGGGRPPSERGVCVVVDILEELVVHFLVHERSLHSVVVSARHLFPRGVIVVGRVPRDRPPCRSRPRDDEEI